ncbi:hypothetical protein C414_000020030 [Campylobacter jejuni subsp. jejuni 414]|nr:hypothetical protein C414_000020030 [Campylobacter jejuni subsp. jejuni 414]
MVKWRPGIGFGFLGFSPFLNFFMVKCCNCRKGVNMRFSPFLNFFMVKFIINIL